MILAYSVAIVGVILLVLVFLPVIILVVLFFVYKSQDKDLKGVNTDKFIKFLQSIWNKIYQATLPKKSDVQDAEFREVKK